MRNAFGEHSIFYLPDGSKILWSHIVSLQNLQWEKGLHLANKLTKDHINFHKKKMKVYLATQVLSNSVADSLQFCAETLEDDEFKETEATCQFLRIFNMIFDILDSNHRFCLKKQAMKVENKENWTKEFKKTENFIKSLHMFDPTCEPQTKKKKPLKKLVVEGPRKRGFLGFLVNMDSFKAMFETYVEKKEILEYICGHKCSQDHLERTFGTIRSSLGSNNNPTVTQFKSAMCKILLGASHIAVAENTQAQDETTISVPTSTGAAVNLFSDLFDLEEEASATEIYLNSLQCNIERRDFEYRDAVLNYIAGFIMRKMKAKEKCVDCALYLSNMTNLKGGKLLNIKNRGGLTKMILK